MSRPKKRAKRKVVGHRDASSGEFVTDEFAADNPDTTVAVTEEVKSAQEAHDDYAESLFREQGDREC